jgi:hypothetical protein
MSREENPQAVHELHSVMFAVSLLEKKLLHLQESL